MKKFLISALTACLAVMFVSVCAWGEVTINTANFPDSVFREFVSSNFDSDNDGVLSDSELDSGKNINLENLSITSLQGIENFTALLVLNCRNNQISAIDVSSNKDLIYLDCSGNRLTSVNVGSNTGLVYLNVGSNQISAIDISGNTILRELDCSGNAITDLDVTRNTALTTLNCGSNRLSALDVSQNTALTNLACDNNNLDTLDVASNTALTVLDCGSNQFSALDVSQNTALTNLACDNNNINTLDVASNTALTVLDCGSNQFSALDVSQNTALTNLACDNNNINTLDVASNTALTVLDCGSNRLSALDVSQNTALTNLACDNNNLDTLDVASNTALTALVCGNNQLSALDTGSNTALTLLTFNDNNITVMDLSKNIALQILNCNGNHITALDLSNNTALTSVNCSSQTTSISSINTRDDFEYPYSINLNTLKTSMNLSLDVQEFISRVSSPDILTSDSYTVSHSTDVSAGIVYLAAEPSTIAYSYNTENSGDAVYLGVTVSISGAMGITITPSSQTIVAGGTITPITWTVRNSEGTLSATTSTLPEGLTYSADNGAITGTISTEGEYSITITATDSSRDAYVSGTATITAEAPLNALTVDSPVSVGYAGGTFNTTAYTSGTASGDLVWSITSLDDEITADVTGSGSSVRIYGIVPANETFTAKSYNMIITVHDDTITVSDTLTVTVEADPNDGGTSGTAYVLHNSGDFAEMMYGVNDGTEPEGRYYQLADDVDLTGINEGFTAVFTGHLNGNGHTLTHSFTQGLFGTVSTDGTAIENLSVISLAGISGSESTAGGITARLVNGTITGCTFSGDVTASGDESSAGGIVGTITGGSIEGCNVLDGSKISAVSYAGGIAGLVSGGAILRCESEAEVSADYAGGIAGFTSSDRDNIYSNTFPEEYPEVGNYNEPITYPIELIVAPLMQTITVGERISDITVTISTQAEGFSWSFRTSPQLSGLTSQDMTITGQTAENVSVGTYTLTVTAENSTGSTASASTTIIVNAIPAPNNSRPHAFRMSDTIRSNISSAFARKFPGLSGYDVYQFSDDEIDSQTWALSGNDTQQLTEMGRQAVVTLPTMRPSNTGIYILRYSLDDVSVGEPLSLYGITESSTGNLSASAIQNMDYMFMDEDGNEITSVPENKVVYAAMNLNAGTETHGVIAVPSVAETIVIPVAPESHDELREIIADILSEAESIDIAPEDIKFVKEENITEAPEATTELVNKARNQDYDIVGKLSTIAVEEPGYYVFRVRLSDELAKTLDGVSVDRVGVYAVSADVLPDAKVTPVRSSFAFMLNGILSTWEILTLSGQKFDRFGVREFLMVGFLNSSQPLSLYLARAILFLLGMPAGCNAGIGLAGLACAVMFIIYRKRH